MQKILFLVSKKSFSWFHLRSLFVQLSPESQLIRSGLYPFRINPKWPVYTTQ